MKLAIVASLISVLPVFAARIPIKTPSGPVKPDSYIVVLKPTAVKASHLAGLTKIAAHNTASATVITHDFQHVLHGYSALLTGASLQYVLTSSDVEYVEADGIASVNYDNLETRDESIALAVRELGLEARASGGAGVVIYGLDTGIYTAHNCFGGRASWGATFGGYANADGNGHGTFMAGAAVGTSFGVATSATAVAVKVLSDSGSGTYSDIISGVDYAFSQFQASLVPSIVLIGFGGPRYSPLDSAVSNAISGGLHFVIAAGDAGMDASNFSPQGAAGAIVVGAVDSNNVMMPNCNYGPLVTVFALGVNILSAWIGRPSATIRSSGTFAAAAQVAGILAVALGEYGQVSPASLKSSLQSHAQPVVTGQPSGTTNLKAVQW